MEIRKNKPIVNPELIEEEKWTIIGVAITMALLVAIPFFITDANIALVTFVNGFLNSSLLIAVALGFSLIFGVAKQFKLSIGGYFVIAAYAMFYLFQLIQINPDFDVGKNLIVDLTPVFSLQFENLITIHDGLYLLLLVLLPLMIGLALSISFLFLFDDRMQKYLAFIIPVATGLGIYLLIKTLTYSIITLLSVALFIASLYYLEISQKRVVTSAAILGITIVLLYRISYGISLLGFTFTTSPYITPFIIRYFLLMNIGVIFVAVIAMIIDRWLLNKIRHSEVNVLIVTFSIALILQSLVQIVWFPKDGSNFEAFGVGTHSLKPVITGSIVIFGNTFDTVRFYALIVIVTAVIALFLFLNSSKMGLAMKAVSQDEEAAALVGVNIRKITAVVSGIGMGLVGLSAILTSPFSSRPFWGPYMGWTVLILAIAVVTLGGMGSLVGTAISALIIGYTSSVVSIIDPSLTSLIPLAFILLIMIFKPNGILGKEKELE